MATNPRYAAIVAIVGDQVTSYHDGPARLLFDVCNMRALESGPTGIDPIAIDRFLAGVAQIGDSGTGRPVTCDDFWLYSRLINALVVAAPEIKKYMETRGPNEPAIEFASCPIAFTRDRYFAYLTKCFDADATENIMYWDLDQYSDHCE